MEVGCETAGGCILEGRRQPKGGTTDCIRADVMPPCASQAGARGHRRGHQHEGGRALGKRALRSHWLAQVAV